MLSHISHFACVCFVGAADVEYKSKVAQEQLEARIVQLTNEKEELVTNWQEELKTANECEISVLHLAMRSYEPTKKCA